MGALHVHNKSGKSTPRPEAINPENCRRVSAQEATITSRVVAENIFVRILIRSPSATDLLP